MTMKTSPLLLSALFAALVANAMPAQMEKRWSGLFGPTKYEATTPRINTLAPDLQLWDLEGRPRSLHLERGRTVVLIGGSYT